MNFRNKKSSCGCSKRAVNRLSEKNRYGRLRGRRLYENMKVGEVIFDQLGGNRFIAMTGAKNFIYDSENQRLSFRLGRGAKQGINYVRVTLTGRDTYDIEFSKLRGLNYKILTVVEDVYLSELRSVFTEYTGFYTSL